MATSPTQRTKKLLQDAGWRVGIVEHWNPHASRRVDLFGFIDLVAIKKGRPILAVQTTTTGVSERCRKITEDCADAACEWLGAGGAIVVVGWRKLARATTARGHKRKGGLWRPRIVEVRRLWQTETNAVWHDEETADVSQL